MSLDDDLRAAWLKSQHDLVLGGLSNLDLEGMRLGGSMTALAREEARLREEMLALVNPRSAFDVANLDSLILAQRVGAQATTTMLDVEIERLKARSISAYVATMADQVRLSSELAIDFRRPASNELALLYSSITPASARVTDMVSAHLGLGTQVHDAIAAMKSPWVHAQDALASMTSIAEIHSMGALLKSPVGAYEDLVANALRLDLGDWRQSIKIPDAVFEDPRARAAFYVEQGFDARLTELPDEAFDESVAQFEVFDFQSGDGEIDDDLRALPAAMHSVSAEEEAAFARTNRCHALS